MSTRWSTQTAQPPRRRRPRCWRERLAFARPPEDAPQPPWEFAWLGASVFALLLGTLSFGVPALAAGGSASSVYLVRRKPQRRAIVLLSIFLALLGLVSGVAVSWYWWFGWKRTA